ARLCNRNYATTADVDAVYPFVLRKFETVLSWLIGDANGEGDQSARKEARETLIWLKFRGQNVTTKEVAKLFPTINEKSVGRYLEAICGQRNPDGSWTAPPFSSDLAVEGPGGST